MSAGRILLLVFGSLIALLGFTLGIAGGGLLWAHSTQRDADGFYTTSTEVFETSTFALTSARVDLGAGSEADGRWADIGDLATVRISATATDSSRGVFVGIGPEEEVETYLAGVAHARVTDVELDPFRATYVRRAGARAPSRPADRSFWAAHASGRGTQTVEWALEPGRWEVVVMDPEATRGVGAEIGLGVKVDVVLPVAIGLLAGGLVLLGAGVTMVVVGARGGGTQRRSRPPTMGTPPA